MKTVSWGITSEQADAFLNQLTLLGFQYLEIPGVLQDNYICDLGDWNSHRLKLGRYKLRRYFLIREVYKNEWSSGLELELTDDDSVYEAWVKHYENSLKEQEGEIA